MRTLFVALSLTACSPASEPPIATEQTAIQVAAAPTPVRDSCKDIAALAAAMSEPEPFASLRIGPASNAPATCTLARVEPTNTRGTDVYTANCIVFSSGILEREANAARAKAAFDAARADLDRCLPQGWSSRDGSLPDPNATEVMIYESAADAKRSMDASSYLYPVELRKEWSEGGVAGPPGWHVTLNFQREGAAKPAPDQQ